MKFSHLLFTQRCFLMDGTSDPRIADLGIWLVSACRLFTHIFHTNSMYSSPSDACGIVNGQERLENQVEQLSVLDLDGTRPKQSRQKGWFTLNFFNLVEVNPLELC